MWAYFWLPTAKQNPKKKLEIQQGSNTVVALDMVWQFYDVRNKQGAFTSLSSGCESEGLGGARTQSQNNSQEISKTLRMWDGYGVCVVCVCMWVSVNCGHCAVLSDSFKKFLQHYNISPGTFSVQPVKITEWRTNSSRIGWSVWHLWASDFWAVVARHTIMVRAPLPFEGHHSHILLCQHTNTHTHTHTHTHRRHAI